jgi:hypothetical protein
MDFFQPIVEEVKRNKNFSSVLVPFRKAERELFNQWADGFVDRDGKLVEEFQTTFNSTFWEFYLFACFKEYGFVIDWSCPSPDFCLSAKGVDIVVEATTANSAKGKPSEWDRDFNPEELKVLRRFKELNTEAIIRLSNAILSKAKKYREAYKVLAHVKKKPFVLAVAPFEQPHFNYQYDRPIRALLYDYYVDEDAYLANPAAYPEGPPGFNLGIVEKDNGAEIPLGFFNDGQLSEISAVVFSCTGTWGKLSAMSSNPATTTQVHSIWATAPRGAPEKRKCSPSEHEESILDGLQIYHNPYADHPLAPEVFRAPRVVQHYFDGPNQEWVYEGRTDALLFRQVWANANKENAL